MELQESSLWREVMSVINSGPNPVHFSWSAVITANGETITPLRVLSVDILTDYELNYGDVIMLEVLISAGTYASMVYPYKANLDIQLFKNPLVEIGDNTDNNALPQSEHYTATLVDTGNPIVEANGFNIMTQKTLDLTAVWKVSFQLVNKALEQIRMISVGGIYRNVTTTDVIQTVLTNESKKIDVEGVRMPVGVDIVEGTNTEVRDHVVIPHGMPLVQLPEYIHRHCGGVYSSGFGYYLQGDYWYVYPCYDTTRFQKTMNTMTIINIPKNKLPNIERTYQERGTSLMVLATGEVKLKDDSEEQQLNHGNGVRFADANNFMSGFTDTVDNKTVVSRGANNSEFISVPRLNGNNNVQLSSNPITANPFMEYSKLARRQGNIVTLTWENSQPSLIYPGMPIKLLYMEDDDVVTVYGILLKAHSFVQTKGQGITDNRHLIQTALSIFIKRINTSTDSTISS